MVWPMPSRRYALEQRAVTTPPENRGDDEEHRRTRQNIAVLGLLVVLLVLGLWLFTELRAYLRVEACLEAGYRNCGTEQH
jgi:hypothetical protein